MFHSKYVSLLIVLMRINTTFNSIVPGRYIKAYKATNLGSVLFPYIIEFNYDPNSPQGPHNWNNLFPQLCSDIYDRQSPIHLNTANIMYGRPYHIEYNSYGALHGTLWNNGHSVEFIIDRSSGRVLTGFLPDMRNPYMLKSFHIHFGNHPRTGSEHASPSGSFSGEIHLVHTEQSKQTDVSVVVAVFLKVSFWPTALTDLDRFILRYIPRILNPNENVTASIDLSSLMPSSGHFYTYTGSLTTPVCAWFIRWVVMKNPLCISYLSWIQLSRLLDMHNEPISQFGNNRPLQSINTHEIEANFGRDEDTKCLQSAQRGRRVKDLSFSN